jgi:CDP-glycerol glycerophosphotransferase (TagB/SpsB family)
MNWRSTMRGSVDAIDRAVAGVTGRRRVLFYVRTAMHAGVLEPMARVLRRDDRVEVRHLAENAGEPASIDSALGRRLAWTSRERAAWLRIDLLVTADPWSPPLLHRCRRRINFFHGVAGKYDLDDPRHLPIGFDLYDRVAFVNRDRMQRYLALGVVRPEAAVLVGFPKLDGLVNGRIDGAAVRERLGLEMHRRTAIYAPTWSPASSLNIAGEGIVASLVEAGWNVVVKPHARSFDLDPRYSGGIDWRRRLRAIEVPGRVVLCDDGDASPLLAASDLMVTDHSTIGFEFCLLDKPVIVFDAPDLAVAARINPERIEALRSAARVVGDPSEVGAAADHEIAHPQLRRAARLRVAQPLFHDPGNATERALTQIYELLDLPAYHVRDLNGREHAVGASL